MVVIDALCFIYAILIILVFIVKLPLSSYLNKDEIIDNPKYDKLYIFYDIINKIHCIFIGVYIFLFFIKILMKIFI